ncbi:hypothetical protein ENBRE01_2319 [Enteropsectra breve]|nr:hypothetical protein ENBRE01_2319 [Enteropsectra breve]
MKSKVMLALVLKTLAFKPWKCFCAQTMDSDDAPYLSPEEMTEFTRNKTVYVNDPDTASDARTGQHKTKEEKITVNKTSESSKSAQKKAFNVVSVNSKHVTEVVTTKETTKHNGKRVSTRSSTRRKTTKINGADLELLPSKEPEVAVEDPSMGCDAFVATDTESSCSVIEN